MKIRPGSRWKNKSPSYSDVIVTEVRETKIHFLYVGDSYRRSGYLKPRQFLSVFEKRWKYNAERWFHIVSRVLFVVGLLAVVVTLYTK